MNDSERDEIFARARRAANPSEDDRRRVRSALSRKLGVVAVAGSAAAVVKAAASQAPAVPAAASVAPATVAGASAAEVAAAPAVASVGFTGLSLAKVALMVAVVGASSAAALPAATRAIDDWRGAPAQPVATSLHPAPPARAYPSASPGGAAASAPSPVVTAAVPAVPSIPSSPARGTTERATSRSSIGELPSTPASPPAAADEAEAAAEIERMAEVQSALRAGDAAGALSLIEQHERLFPRSILAPEREGAKVLARCQTSPRAEARELGRSFLSGYPRSPLGERVRVTCGLENASR